MTKVLDFQSDGIVLAKSEKNSAGKDPELGRAAQDEVEVLFSNMKSKQLFGLVKDEDITTVEDQQRAKMLLEMPRFLLQENEEIQPSEMNRF